MPFSLFSTSTGTEHLIPETPQRVIKIIKEKLRERCATGPAGFLKLFRDIDADHGGTIDREEMRRFLQYYALGNDDEVFEEIFRKFDPDNSGDIDMNEFLVHLLDQSVEEESFSECHLVEGPHYTRPPEYKGMVVPDVLLSGHHAKIVEWRQKMAEERTRKNRPDLLE